MIILRACSINGLYEEIFISYDKVDSDILMQVKSDSIGELNLKSDDLFEAMIKIRLLLEDKEFRLLCNGARRDAYPSRMSREFGSARKIYIHRLGESTRKEDLVDIFDQAKFVDVSTVADQKKYYQNWTNSLGL